MSQNNNNVAPILRRREQFAQEVPLSPVGQLEADNSHLREQNALLANQNSLLKNENDDLTEQLVETKNRHISSDQSRLALFFPDKFNSEPVKALFSVIDDDAVVGFSFSVEVVPLNVGGVVSLTIDEPDTATSCVPERFEIKSLNLHIYKGQLDITPDFPSVTILMTHKDDDDDVDEMIEEIEIDLTNKLVFITLCRLPSTSERRRSVREEDDNLPPTQTKKPRNDETDDESNFESDSPVPEKVLF